MNELLFLMKGSSWIPISWSWQWVLILVLMVTVIAPTMSNAKVRYYACYITYAFWVSMVCLIWLPFFMLRPRNIDNLRLGGISLKNLTTILGIKWTLRNGHILKKKRAAVISSNHQSVFDIEGMLYIWDIMEPCTSVAKKELYYAVPFGPVAWLAGLIFIDRNKTKDAVKSLNAASTFLSVNSAKIWIFPEGTRNKKAEKLLPFKKGAFKLAIEAGVPIIPVVYSPYYFIDSKNKTFDKGEIIISVLDEIPTVGLKAEDTEHLMNKVYAVMEEEYQKLKLEVNQKYCSLKLDPNTCKNHGISPTC